MIEGRIEVKYATTCEAGDPQRASDELQGDDTTDQKTSRSISVPAFSLSFPLPLPVPPALQSSALEVAARAGRVGVVEYLLQSGAVEVDDRGTSDQSTDFGR